MSQDREAVVWTRLGMAPVRMGRIYLTDSDCRFSYDPGYLQTGLHGLGLIHSPAIYQDHTIVWKRTESFDFLPPIQSLIPPRSDMNFQRQLVLNYLAKRGTLPSRGIDADWEILKVAGHGAIGHLDVFESDEKALAWYSAPVESGLFEITEDFGFSLKEFLTWFDEDADDWLRVIGPTPTVGGAIPKLLVSIPASGWDGRIGLPTRTGAHDVLDIVLKFEQTNIYPGIIELEALALDIHREAGFEVPRHWKVEINGIPSLAIERFDRDATHVPVFMETLYSIIASGDSSVTTNYSYSYEKLGIAIDRSPIELVSDREESKRHLLRRLILAMLTGNGDLHMENLSILDAGNGPRFSPVYDPTPMRAYSLHNLLSVMPFGNYGETLGEGDKVVGFADAILNLARNLGVRKSELGEILSTSMAVTADYDERVGRLDTLPDVNKENLIAITRKVVAMITQLRDRIA